jgi:hypothetical protein
MTGAKALSPAAAARTAAMSSWGGAASCNPHVLAYNSEKPRKPPINVGFRWCARRDSNPRPQPGATLPAGVQGMLNDLIARAQASGATVTTSTGVIGDASRPVPGAPGGSLTPEETAQALAGGAAALGLQPMNARLIAAHEVQMPAGFATVPGGTWDLTLDLAPAGGSGYSTVLRINFSSEQKRQAIAEVGRELPVLADPARHDRIMIDTSRLI